ncbi:hypothetical protein ACFFRR_005031 [Megaselia abdita]
MGCKDYNLFCCCCGNASRSKLKPMSILLLGLESSGKTEIGHLIVKKQRQNFDSTNGVQNFTFNNHSFTINITEVGGNKEMQKLWHHYFIKTMAIVYCYDMSSSPSEMENSFKVFNTLISNEYVRGKPILIVGTKADLVTYNVESYDIENMFELEKLANIFGSKLKVCQNSSLDHDDLSSGCLWLEDELNRDYKCLKNRLKLDKHQSSKKHRKRLSYWFTRKKIHSELNSSKRPKTAPTISKTILLYS